MIDNSAISIGPTSTGTGIYTPVSRAALVSRTVRVDKTFRSAGGIRISGIISRTDAIDSAVLFFALSIRSTRIRFARTRFLHRSRFNCNSIDGFENNGRMCALCQ